MFRVGHLQSVSLTILRLRTESNYSILCGDPATRFDHLYRLTQMEKIMS